MLLLSAEINYGWPGKTRTIHQLKLFILYISGGYLEACELHDVRFSSARRRKFP